MGRKPGSKNKTAEQKIDEALELASEAHAIAPEEMKAEIAEAVEELAEVVAPEEKKEKKKVGHHPITKEPVYA